MIRVVLVDDHELFRAGVRGELGTAIEVVGEAGSVTALLRAIATQGAVEQPAGRLALLADLERSLDSFDELHRRR